MADQTPPQMARPLLAYQCPTGFDTAPDLCRAFGDLLGEKAPGHALRRLSPDEETPALRPADLLVRLAARMEGEHRLSAHIAWQEGGAAAPVAGPEVTLESSDAPLAPSMYAGFLQDLWHLAAPPALTGTDP